MDFMDPLWGRPAERIPSPGVFLPRDDDLIELLRSTDFDTKISSLNNIVTIARRDREWFTRFARKGDLFKCLDRILSEDRWEVQHTCCKMLMEVMATFGNSMEYCMCFLLPKIIPLMGNSKTTVRSVSAQLVQRYLTLQPEALPALLKITSNYLLSPNYTTTKAEIVVELPRIYIQELRQANWANLVDGLTKWMSNCDQATRIKCVTTLKKLEVFIGKDIFRQLLSKYPQEQQSNYLDLEGSVEVETPDIVNKKRMSGRQTAGERRFRFGFVPMQLSAMLADDDVKNRQHALEEIKKLVENITPEEIGRLVPHMHSYLMTLGNVLADLNFRMVVTGLDVLRLTVNRMKASMEPHLQQVVTLLSKHLGNQKAIIKQILMMTFMDLFQNLNPKMVVGTLAVHLENRNSRIREEVLNILTSALMIISPSRLNFTAVVNMLVPLLIDPKRRVRLAAFEHLSVVTYLMNGKLESLMKSVRDIETKHNLLGLAAAVQARAKRQLLPRIRFDGLIEYSTPPTSDSTFDLDSEEMAAPENADLRWILHGNTSDTFDRPVSPLSRVLESPSVTVNSIPWEHERNSIGEPSFLLQGRMMSDDMIVRRAHEAFMGSAVTRSQSAQARVSPITSSVTTTKAIPQPSSSTASWHAPTRPHESLHIDENRSSSAVVRRRDSTECKISPMIYGGRTSMDNKIELNNNEIITPAGRKISKSGSSSGLSKAKSEGNLVGEERENRPPVNPDDAPIRPSKNGTYIFEDASDLAAFSSPVKKSISHHSLPISTSTKKKHAFLKSGSAKNSHSKSLTSKSSEPVKTSNSIAKANGHAPVSKSNGSVASKSNGSTGGSVQSALNLINSEEWTLKVDGLTMISKLSFSNPKAIGDNMHDVVLAVVNECKNLRSSVSRVALTALGDLFENMKSKMDSEIEKGCMILMQKAGDVSSAFIREDASEALQKLVKHASPGKTLTCLIAAGSKSKNNTIRASCAHFVCTLVQRVGTSQVLNSPELAKLIPQLISFSKDQTPHVRQAGRQTLVDLSNDSSFDRMMRKNVNESEYKAVKEILGHIEKKGGIDALDSTNISLGSSLSRSGSVRKAISRKLPDGAQLDLDECRNQMTAAGWEKRVAGLQRFEQMCSSTPKVVASDTKIIEAFIGRLSDINSKVAIEGMNTYLSTLPVMSKLFSTETQLKAVLNQLILALMSHLSSKSEDHRHLAQTCLEQTVAQIDGAALSPAMSAALKKANVKQKPFMLEVYTKMVCALYPSKPKQVEVTALPTLWDCIQLGLADADLKKAVTLFAKQMSNLMGYKNLMDHATSELDPPRRKFLESILH